MKCWNRAARLRALGICLLGLAVPAQAVVTPSLNDWRWGSNGVNKINVGVNVSAEWLPFVAPALADWSRSAFIDLKAVPAIGAANLCAPVYNSIQMCSANYGATGWLGYGYVWVSSGRIVMGNIRLNDYYFGEGSRYDTNAWRAATVCHEVGHTLGLDHNDAVRNNANNGSCLDITGDPSGQIAGYGPRTTTRPGYGDFIGLKYLYTVDDDDDDRDDGRPQVGAAYGIVPEPGSWALFIAGFGLTGAMLRRRRAALA